MSALTTLAGTEAKLFFREPVGVFFMLVFSPLLLVILGLAPAMREPDAEFGGLRAIDVYLPILVAMSLTLYALNSLPQQFATYREKGVLRRMRTTPVEPRTMLVAQVLVTTALSVFTTLVMLAIAWIGYAVDLPRLLPAYVVAFLLSALSLDAIGLLVASLAPSGPAAGGIGTLLFFPMMFFAGLWSPRDGMNHVLRTISDFSPLGAAVQALQDATAGHWPQLLHLAVMLGWTIVAGGLAARYFRWE